MVAPLNNDRPVAAPSGPTTHQGQRPAGVDFSTLLEQAQRPSGPVASAAEILAKLEQATESFEQVRVEASTMTRGLQARRAYSAVTQTGLPA